MGTLLLWTLWNNWIPVMINGAHLYCGGTAGYFSVEQLVTSVWKIYVWCKELSKAEQLGTLASNNSDPATIN